MRQAGRYMPEYRAVREKTTFLDLCKNPALCAEVMVTAVDRLGVDAAIIFSDLLPILEPMGLELEFTAGEGPAIRNPLRGPGDVDAVSRTGVDRAAGLRHRDRATDAGRAADVNSRDRFCRGPVHAGQLRDRRGWQPQLRPRQRPDVPRRRRLGRADGPAGPGGRAVSERADRRRGASGAIVRQLGGLPGAGRLPPLRVAALEGRHRSDPPGRAGDPFRHRQPGAGAAWPPKPAAA